MSVTEPARPFGGDNVELALVERFESRIRMVAIRRVHPDWVDDVVNDVLSAVIEAVRSDRVKEPDRLAAFVHGVTRNVISNWARSEARARRAGELETESAPETPDALRLLVSEERRAAVVSCLDLLREEDQEILYLAYYRGMTPTEVAEELGVGPNVARQRLWRARERFKKKWQGSDAV